MNLLCRLGLHSWRRGSAVLNGWLTVHFPVQTCRCCGVRK